MVTLPLSCSTDVVLPACHAFLHGLHLLNLSLFLPEPFHNARCKTRIHRDKSVAKYGHKKR
jgi:hypothetical protein